MNPPRKINVTIATVECRMCPTIITGTTTEGETIYVRYRWGHLCIRLDHRIPPEFGGAAGAWIFEKQLDPAGISGCISYDELRELTVELIDWPPEITPKTDGDGDVIWPDDVQG